MNMLTAREYAPIDRRTIPDGPTPEELKQWRREAATWVAAQMHQMFRKSEFAMIGDFDTRTFETAVNEALSEATYDVFKKLED
jgi:hypothetical protein